MSFASEVKNELCRQNLSRSCCAEAEAYGVLLYCSTFHSGEIRIVTENDSFADRLPRLFRKAWGIDFDQKPLPSAGGKRTFLISDVKKLHSIIDRLGYDPQQNPVFHINFA